MSALNCRQGDLAVIVHSLTGKSEGMIVHVVAPIGIMQPGQRFAGPDGRSCFTVCNGFYWWVRSEGRPLPVRRYRNGRDVGSRLRTEAHMPDAWLRPIRDGEQPDELLTLVGKPETVSA